MVDARGEKAMDMARNADLVILNTAVAGKWLDAVLKEKVSEVLSSLCLELLSLLCAWVLHIYKSGSVGEGILVL